MNGKAKFLKAMNISSCRRCIIRCQGKQDTIEHKYIGGKWPVFEPAPDPSLIVWENLGKGKIARCGRASMTNIMAFILLCGGFAFIIWLFGLQQSQFTDTTNCGNQKYGIEAAYE